MGSGVAGFPVGSPSGITQWDQGWQGFQWDHLNFQWDHPRGEMELYTLAVRANSSETSSLRINSSEISSVRTNSSEISSVRINSSEISSVRTNSVRSI